MEHLHKPLFQAHYFFVRGEHMRASIFPWKNIFKEIEFSVSKWPLPWGSMPRGVLFDAMFLSLTGCRLRHHKMAHESTLGSKPSSQRTSMTLPSPRCGSPCSPCMASDILWDRCGGDEPETGIISCETVKSGMLCQRILGGNCKCFA